MRMRVNGIIHRSDRQDYVVPSTNRRRGQRNPGDQESGRDSPIGNFALVFIEKLRNCLN